MTSQDYNPFEYNPYQASSCTIESAVQRLLNIPLDRTKQTWVGNATGQGEWLGEELDDVLRTDLEDAEYAYQIAKGEKLAADVIADKLSVLEQCQFRCKEALRYEREIIDELAKLDKSELRVDHLSTINPKYPLLTIASLELWSLKKYGISVIDFDNSAKLAEEFRSQSKTPQQPKQAITSKDTKPWLIPDDRDPAVTDGTKWIISARYFARQLVEDDITLKIKRDRLADKVATLLVEHSIKKRGGKKNLATSTVFRALSDMNYD